MKPTQEQVIAWAHKAEIGDSHGHIIRHELAHLERFATLAYEAGRNDENEACRQVAYDMAHSDEQAMEVSAAIRARREQ